MFFNQILKIFTKIVKLIIFYWKTTDTACSLRIQREYEGQRLQFIKSIYNIFEEVMLKTERTSILKKKGLGSQGQYQNMHLAVYPFQIQYVHNVDFKTVFYFQKDYQIIGEVTPHVSPFQKGVKYRLESPENIFYFRLFSQNHVVYKWSLYRCYDSGEEEFQESVTINLKDIISNFIIPQKSPGSRSMESLINLSYNCIEQRCKFTKLGIIIDFSLFISDDPKRIRQQFERRYFPTNQPQVSDSLHLPLQHPNLLKADSNDYNNIQLSSKKNQSESIHIDSNAKKGSLSLNEPSNSLALLKNQSKERSLMDGKAISSNKIQKYDLDDLILNDNCNHQKGDVVYNIDDDYKQLTLQIKEEKQKDQARQKEYLNHIDQSSQKKEGQNGQQAVDQYGNKKRDYAILKLESDQGRLRQDPIDRKLQLQELEVIQEEEKRSTKDTIYNTIAPKFQSKVNSKSSLRTQKLQNKSSDLKEIQEKEISSIQNKIFSFKKLIILFIAVAVLFMITVTLNRHFSAKKPSKPRKIK